MNEILPFVCIHLTDINECDSDNECSTFANCEDTEGSYSCNCKEGYQGDGYACSGKLDKI